jgi:alkylhydroperoxidase family enzyme
LGRPHPVTHWLRLHHADRRIGRRGRGNLIRAWHAGDTELRRVLDIWATLPAGTRPREEGLRRLRRVVGERDDLSRELAALRAVQSLTVLDVGNYRSLVFALGGYAADGEDPSLARRMP